MLKCASKDHGDDHHGHAQAGHADNDPHDHPHKHIQGNKPNQAKNGKLRVLRKKKKLPVFNVRNSEESGWEGIYDTDTTDVGFENSNEELEWREYPYESEDLTEYHAHPHEHPHHGHDISSVYTKYDDLRPLDLTKLIPMLSLLGLYLLSPTFLHARKKRDNFQISGDGLQLDEENKRQECFLRLACRVGELSKEVGVLSNPLVAELMENDKFAETVEKYKEVNKCNTYGCEKLLTF